MGVFLVKSSALGVQSYNILAAALRNSMTLYLVRTYNDFIVFSLGLIYGYRSI